MAKNREKRSKWAVFSLWLPFSKAMKEGTLKEDKPFLVEMREAMVTTPYPQLRLG